MALPEFSMRQLLEAGVHFGHQTARWNPRMGEFIYGSRNGIHILDLTQTVPMLDAALNAVRETVAKGGRVLFVGTKRQAQAPIRDAAEKSAQYYMNHRWLGGTLTNWQTVSQSINRLRDVRMLQHQPGRFRIEARRQADEKSAVKSIEVEIRVAEPVATGGDRRCVTVAQFNAERLCRIAGQLEGTADETLGDRQRCSKQDFRIQQGCEEGLAGKRPGRFICAADVNSGQPIGGQMRRDIDAIGTLPPVLPAA